MSRPQQQHYKYFPTVERSGYLADQVYSDHQQRFMDHAHDGSPYNLYDQSGNINKAVPLTARPPVNQVFPGFRGMVAPSQTNPHGLYEEL